MEPNPRRLLPNSFAILSASFLIPVLGYAQAAAPASRAEAVRQYPQLAEAGSRFNRRFLELVQETKLHDTLFLSRDDWPMEIASRVAIELGVKPTARAGVVTLKEMESDLPGFIGKTVLVEGKIDVSSYYNFSYRDTDAMALYAFEISDGSGRGYAYGARESFEAVRRAILDGKKSLYGVFQIRISESRAHSASEGVMADFLKVVLTYPAPARDKRD